MRDFLEEAARLQEPNAQIEDPTYEYGKQSDFGPLSSNDENISIENYNTPSLPKKVLDFSSYIKAIPNVLSDGLSNILPSVAGSMSGLAEIDYAVEEPTYSSTSSELSEISEQATAPFRDQQITALPPELSNAANWLVNQAISEGCEGLGGTMHPRGLFIVDLDIDGRDDLILSHDGIECGPRKTKSNSCGIKVCETFIYLRRGGILDQAGSFVGTVTNISDNTPPRFTFSDHSQREQTYSWNGNGFSQR